MHGFTILGDGPSGDIKATIAKDSDYFIVGQDILQRFCVDQRFDAVADGLCRRGIGTVKRHAHCKGEKIFELEYATRCCDVFVGRDTANGTFVNIQYFPNVAQNQRFKILDAFVQELFLMAHDFSRYFKNCLGTLV